MKAKDKKEHPPTVTLTIRGIAAMSKEERLLVGTWLHDWGMTMMLMEKPEQYSKVFKATYR